MAVKTYPKGTSLQLSPHFSLKEMECPCNQCKETLVDDDLIQLLERIRTQLNQPLRVTSGYRCQDYQDDLKRRGYETATGVSQHTLGRAADITSEGVSGPDLEKSARSAGATSVGVGGTWIHVDLRPGYRRWTYTR